MKAALRIEVRRYSIVTVQAKHFLPVFVEHLVAGRAFGFQIRMTGDYLARHHKRFEVLSECLFSCCRS